MKKSISTHPKKRNKIWEKALSIELLVVGLFLLICSVIFKDRLGGLIWILMGVGTFFLTEGFVVWGDIEKS